jgi:hypothetical protein
MYINKLKNNRCKECGVGFRAKDLDLNASNLLMELPENVRGSIVKESLITDTSLAGLKTMRLQFSKRLFRQSLNISLLGFRLI